jgi:hypothetical protein
MRKVGWHLIAPAAVCVAAGAMSVAMAQDWGSTSPDVPATTGGVAPRMIWGGPVPAPPRPGEVPLYRPSPSVVDGPVPQSAYAPAATSQPFPAEPEPQAYPEPSQPDVPDAVDPSYPDAVEPAYPDAGEASLPDAAEAPAAMEPVAVEPAAAPRLDDGSEPSTRRLYRAIDASTGEAEPDAGAMDAPPDRAELPPLADPVDIEAEPRLYPLDEASGGGPAGLDPWNGLKDVSPDAVPPTASRRSSGARGEDHAALEPAALTRRRSPADGDVLLDRGRGSLESETPSGYEAMPTSETMCRRALQKLGVRFVDATSVRSSRRCGIDYPVKVAGFSQGVAMRPPATLNCMAALRVAQWMKDEVMPAARWKLLRRPTALINASSYRCTRIAGSGSLSEHASGSALDVHGFAFADGSTVEIEKKGFFEFSEKAFQRSVRESACRYFGTVLGPGYNEDHADHLHLDTRQRRRAVCK